MRTTIIIYRRGSRYYCDAYGKFGSCYSGAHAGDTAEVAALFAQRESGRYIAHNSEGGDMYLPTAVQQALSRCIAPTGAI